MYPNLIHIRYYILLHTFSIHICELSMPLKMLRKSNTTSQLHMRRGSMCGIEIYIETFSLNDQKMEIVLFMNDLKERNEIDILLFIGRK